jgi:hypothetical protein
MLDLGLAVIDRLITLVKGRIEGRKEMFAQVIEPVFTDLITIHGDYIKIFDQAESCFQVTEEDLRRVAGPVEWRVGGSGERHLIVGRLTDDQTDELERIGIRRARDYLSQARRELEPIREKARAMMLALGKAKLEAEEKAFLTAVGAYLCNEESIERLHNRWATAITNLIEYLTDLEHRTSLSERAAHRVVREAGTELRYRWSDLCTHYAELKVTIASTR